MCDIRKFSVTIVTDMYDLSVENSQPKVIQITVYDHRDLRNFGEKMWRVKILPLLQKRFPNSEFKRVVIISNYIDKISIDYDISLIQYKFGYRIEKINNEIIELKNVNQN